MTSDRRLTRRTLLAAGATTAAAAVAGCGQASAPAAVAASGAAGSGKPSATSAATSTSTSPTPAATPAAPVPSWAIAAAAGESSLVASYDVVSKAHPALKARLAPLRAAHAAHLKALKVTTHGKAISGLPAAQAEALSRLAGAEQKASDTVATLCLTCPVEGAVLLGSIAAADAGHAVVLASIGSA